MKCFNRSLQLAMLATTTCAFTPVSFRQQSLQISSQIPVAQNKVQSILFSSQWDDDDDDDAVVQTRTSYDDAGETLRNAEDQDKVDGMEDFDANPAYKEENIDRVRQAIKERTASLGIEKSTRSVEAIKEAEERAKLAAENGPPQALDLSQISTVGPSSSAKDDVPSMFYEPEDDMSEDDIKEADPTGQLSIQEQFATEIGAATWPTAANTLKRVGLLLALAFFTGGIIIGADIFLRDFYTNLNLIPRKEDIMNGAENMVLPDSWSDGASGIVDNVKNSLPDL